MEKKSRSRVFLLKLCSHEKAIIRGICLLLVMLVVSMAFSGFCSVTTTTEYKQIKSTTIDFAASAENNAAFLKQYNTLRNGTSNAIADSEDIKSSKDMIGDAVSNMYSAAVSLNFQKEKMMDLTDEEPESAQTEAETEPASANADEAQTQPETQPPATEPETAAPQTSATTQAATQPQTTAPQTTQEQTTETAGSAVTAAASVNTISVKTPPETLMLDENGVPVNYTRVIKGNASAYAGDGRTATGTVPVPGSVAVNPNIIPYGTKMWIVSDDGSYVYGYAVAEDTGGFIHWSNAPVADLFFDSESACYAFGRRNITIYILE